MFDRAEEQQASGNRPGTWQRLRIGARHDGRLTAISLLSYGTAGIASGAGVGNIAQAMYQCPNFEMAQYDVFTNAGPGCAMRAPGNVQGAFALEQLVDELAEKLDLDPLALRDRIDPSAVRREERRVGAARFGWSRRRAAADTGPLKRGIGIAQSFWPGIVQTSASCEVRLQRDGSSSCVQACKISAAVSAPCWRKSLPRNSGCGRRMFRSASAIRIFRRGRAREAARRQARSRRPPARPHIRFGRRSSRWRRRRLGFSPMSSRLASSAFSCAAIRRAGWVSASGRADGQGHLSASPTEATITAASGQRAR